MKSVNKYEITILGLLNLKKLGEALKPLKREVKIRKRWKFKKRETSFQLSSLLPRLKLSKAYNYPLLRLYMKVSISKPLFCMKITSYSTFLWSRNDGEEWKHVYRINCLTNCNGKCAVQFFLSWFRYSQGGNKITRSSRYNRWAFFKIWTIQNK